MTCTCNCNGVNNAEYVPLSRTITINGVTFDLRENRSWTVTAEGIVWGIIGGDINDQTDLMALFTEVANDISAEASARTTGDVVTLNAAKAYADGLIVSAFRPGGSWDASGGTWPTQTGTGDPLDGSFLFITSVAGTMGGQFYDVGDNFYNLIPNPGQTDANWSRLEYNTQQATEGERGTARIATSAEVNNDNSTNDTDFITPVKLWAALKNQYPILAAFINGVYAASLQSLPQIENLPIEAGDNLISALGKAQGQINAINEIALIVPGGVNGGLKYVQSVSGAVTPLRISETDVVAGNGIIVPNESGTGWARIKVTDAFDQIVIEEVSI